MRGGYVFETFQYRLGITQFSIVIDNTPGGCASRYSSHKSCSDPWALQLPKIAVPKDSTRDKSVALSFPRFRLEHRALEQVSAKCLGA